MIVNIIHPYVYRLDENQAFLFSSAGTTGTIDKYRERDEKIVEFIQRALTLNVKLLLHQSFEAEAEEKNTQHLLLESDSDLSVLADEKIQVVTTLGNGLPVEDEKPDGVSDEFWQKVCDVIVTRKKLSAVFGSKSPLIFIGGSVESCLGNIVLYSRKFIRTDGEPIFYIPELCVSFDKRMGDIIEDYFDVKNIQPLTFDEAIEKLYSMKGED
jgi:hypothetical protein